MIVDLTGKQAIVTGSTAGIGFAIAEGLAKAGARVVVTGRTQAAVDSAVEAINIGLEAPRAADLATPEGAAVLIAAVPEAYILVNNLGVYGAKPLFDLDDADWETIFGVNVVSSRAFCTPNARSMNDRPPCSSFSARWPVRAMISPRSGHGRNWHAMRKKRSSRISLHSSRKIARRVLPPLRMM